MQKITNFYEHTWNHRVVGVGIDVNELPVIVDVSSQVAIVTTKSPVGDIFHDMGGTVDKPHLVNGKW